MGWFCRTSAAALTTSLFFSPIHDRRMSLSLSERIAARLLLKGGDTKERRKADFLAHKVEIAAAMAAGWSVRSIWETLNKEGKIRVTYQAFCNQVHRWINDTKNQPGPLGIKAPSGSTPKNNTVSATPNHTSKVASGSVDGFRFSATPNSEDLF